MKRPARSPLPRLALDRDSREPLHQQLRGQLRRAIASGAAPARLPSTRALAGHLGISRNTVLAAYEALKLEGALESRAGSGTWHTAPVGVLKRSDLLRDSHYPFGARQFLDPDGHPVYFHR